jgi:hypothetical protein
MAFDNEDVEPGVEEEAGPPPEESSNRPFIIVAAILGGIMLLSLLCVAAYALFWLPRQSEQRAARTETKIAQDTAIAFGAEQTALAQIPTATPTQQSVTATRPAATNTPVVAPIASSTPTTSATERQATIQVMLTEAAVTAAAASPTVTPTGSLPQSGIFDNWNPALLAGLAFVLVVVIVVARRLRSA